MKSIRILRNERSLTIKKAAELSGLSAKNWKEIERQLIVPSLQDAQMIASTLDVKVGDILFQNGLPDNPTVGEGYITHEQKKSYILEPKNVFNSKRMNVIDLFCGVGGLSQGFEESAHFNVCMGIDLMSDRIETFHRNHTDAFAICDDLRRVRFSDIKHRVGRVDVLLGGPPCQGFSSIRPFRTLTENDERNSLPEHYLLAVSELQPKWVVFENVVGILSTRKGNIFNEVVSGLGDLGYYVDFKVINAAELGVPQNRERVFIVGRENNKPFKWMRPVCMPSGRSMASKKFPTLEKLPLFQNLAEPLTVHDAISDLPVISAGGEMTQYVDPPKTEYQKIMRGNCDELKLHNATKHSQQMMDIIRQAGKNRNALPEGLTSSGFSSCYSRLSYDEPSTTLTVNFVHPSSNRCIHPTQDRALTPREGARLQGFKDQFVFFGNRSNIVKQIGNAVPPLVSEKIANMILENL